MSCRDTPQRSTWTIFALWTFHAYTKAVMQVPGAVLKG